jgi:hypothetical protein
MSKFELRVTDSLARIETKLECLDDLQTTCKWVEGLRSCFYVFAWIAGIGVPTIIGWWATR